MHVCRDLVGYEQREGDEGAAEGERSAKAARTPAGDTPGGGAARSTLRHIETEQRRRDRINEGCARQSPAYKIAKTHRGQARSVVECC